MTDHQAEEPAITPDHSRYPKRITRYTTFGAEVVDLDQDQETTDHASD